MFYKILIEDFGMIFFSYPVHISKTIDTHDLTMKWKGPYGKITWVSPEQRNNLFFYCFTCSPCGIFPYPFFFSLHSPIAKFFITCPSVLWILLLLVLRHILLSSWLFLTIFWIANEMLGKCWVLRFVYCRWLLRYFGYSLFLKESSLECFRSRSF